MKTEIRLTPESEEEVELLERLSAVRHYAIKEMGMDPTTVAGIFTQIATGICIEGEEAKPAEPEKVLECPKCETPIEDVEAAGLGADPTVQPCGCSTSWNQLPPELYFEELD